MAVGSKKVEQRSVALCVSNLINQQTGTISKAIEDYAHRKTEREVIIKLNISRHNNYYRMLGGEGQAVVITR